MHRACGDPPTVIQIEERLEKALHALRAKDPVEAARWLEGPLAGPATERAKLLWRQCMDEVPKMGAELQRRLSASRAARAYQRHA
jgi:hypothetical protein